MSNPLELTSDDLVGLPLEVLAELSFFKKKKAIERYVETPLQSLTMTPSKFRKVWSRLTEVQ